MPRSPARPQAFLPAIDSSFHALGDITFLETDLALSLTALNPAPYP